MQLIKKCMLKISTVFYMIFVYALCLKTMQYQNALQQAKTNLKNITNVIRSIFNHFEKILKSTVFHKTELYSPSV